MKPLVQPAHVAVRLTTLTPLWTGDIDGRADRTVQLPGLMGSLRWWWEVLMRGMSAKVGNLGPTSDSSKPDAVQRIFGATGQRRKFRLVCLRNALKVWAVPSRVDIPGCRRSWYFKSGALGGDLDLDIIALDPKFDTRKIVELMYFISRYGALGARPQMGFGVVQARPIEAMKLEKSLIADEMKQARFEDNPSEEVWDGGMPALHNMFFAEVQPKDINVSEKTTFLMKKQLRDAFRGPASSAELRHYVCGHLLGKHRVGSKVMVSRPFDSNRRIRIYGWYPRNVPREAADAVGSSSATLESLRGYSLQTIHKCLKANHTLTAWREMGDSGRGPKETGGPIIFYLRLLGFVNDPRFDS